MLDQANTSNRSCDVGFGKNGYEVHVLSLMRENVYEEMPHMNWVALKDTIEHKKISPLHDSCRVQPTPTFLVNNM